MIDLFDLQMQSRESTPHPELHRCTVRTLRTCILPRAPDQITIPPRFRLVDNLLSVIAGASKEDPKTLADAFRTMAFRKDFISAAGMTFNDVVQAADRLGLVTFDRQHRSLYLKC